VKFVDISNAIDALKNDEEATRLFNKIEAEYYQTAAGANLYQTQRLGNVVAWAWRTIHDRGFQILSCEDLAI
jgi:hypothetical protein